MDRRFIIRFAAFVIPLCVVVFLAGFLILKLLEDKAMLRVRVQQQAAIENARTVIESRLRGVAGDLDFLARHAAMRTFINDANALSERDICHNFQMFSASQKVYDQIRWIDETGMERVRVDFNDGNPRVVPHNELQNKSTRYYFVESMLAPDGSVYISPLDLNIENDRVEVPYKPMIRFALRVQDASGKSRGIVVLNFDAHEMIDAFIKALGDSAANTELLNSEGFWLRSPARADEWSFMFGKRETFFDRYRQMAQKIYSAHSGQFNDGRYLWSWASVFPRDISRGSDNKSTSNADGKPYVWKIVSRVSIDAIPQETDSYHDTVILYSLALVIIGALAAFLAVRGSITREDQKENEVRVHERENELRFELLLSSSPNGMLVVDRSGTILRANEQLAKMLGYSEAQLLAMSVDDLVPEYVAASHANLRREFAKQPSMRKLGSGHDLAARHAVGNNVPVEVSLAPFRMNEQNLVLATVVDITQRKNTEAALNALNVSLEQRVQHRTTELEAANKELEAFAYAVSHDLRAPLRAMIGFSSALQEDFQDSIDARASEYLDEIIFASKSMGALIDGLLALSRTTQGVLQRAKFDISAMARDVAREFSVVEPQRMVTWDIADNLEATGDARMIDTALRNLLGNAWKYTAKTPHAQIQLYEELTPRGRRFVLKDNGAGFDMAHANRLFKPFQRLHRQDEFVGIGIGLATVLRVVRRHGGVIEAQGIPNGGATFRFSFEADCNVFPENNDVPANYDVPANKDVRANNMEVVNDRPDIAG